MTHCRSFHGHLPSQTLDWYKNPVWTKSNAIKLQQLQRNFTYRNDTKPNETKALFQKPFTAYSQEMEQAYITAARSQAGLINHKSRHMAQKTSNLHTEMSHRKTTSISCTRKNVQQNYRLNLAEKQNARPSRRLGWHCETLDSYTSVGHVFTMGGGIIMEETCQCDTYAVCYF